MPSDEPQYVAASSDPGECCDVVGRGVQVIGPENGPLAEGVSGLGRMSEPEAIVVALVQGCLQLQFTVVCSMGSAL